MGRRVHAARSVHPLERDDVNDTLFDDIPPVTPHDSDEWYTPKWVFDALDTVFDLDVCAPINGPMFTPCRAWYSAKDNGLEQIWHGRVFMNPPYSKPQPWIERWRKHGNGIALLPMAKSRWFNDLWASSASCLVLPSNMKFVSANNQPLSLMMQSTLWAMGEECTELLRNSGLGKVR